MKLAQILAFSAVLAVGSAKLDGKPERACCKANVAECLACLEDLSVEDYCKKFENALGCKVDCPVAKCKKPEEGCRPVKPHERTFDENGCPHLCETICKDDDPKGNSTLCCEALTIECEACKEDVPPKEFCSKFPQHFLCDKTDGNKCCKALTAECLACSDGVSEEEYCKKFPKTLGCKETKPCCKALTAECLACSNGVSEEEYCKKFPKTLGCKETKPCCKALTAECLACSKGVSEEEYCKKFPKTVGCKETKPCCKALTAECLACSAGVSQKEYCEDHPNTAGCKGNGCKKHEASCADVCEKPKKKCYNQKLKMLASQLCQCKDDMDILPPDFDADFFKRKVKNVLATIQNTTFDVLPRCVGNVKSLVNALGHIKNEKDALKIAEKTCDVTDECLSAFEKVDTEFFNQVKELFMKFQGKFGSDCGKGKDIEDEVEDEDHIDDPFLFLLSLNEDVMFDDEKCYRLDSIIDRLREYFEEEGSDLDLIDGDADDYDYEDEDEYEDEYEYEYEEDYEDEDDKEDQNEYDEEDKDEYDEEDKDKYDEEDKDKYDEEDEANMTAPKLAPLKKEKYGKGKTEKKMESPEHLSLDELIPMMCTVDEKCISDYLNHALKFLKKEGRTLYSKETVEKIERAVNKYIRPSLKPLYKKYCLGDDKESDEGKPDITITIGNETIPLNELEGEKLKEVLKQLKDNDKISDLIGKKRDKKIKFDKKRAHDIVRNIMADKIVPEISKWGKETIEKVEGVLNGLEPEELDDLPEKTVKESIKAFGKEDNKWDKLQGRAIAKRVKKALGNCSKWNKTTIEDVNSILPSFTEIDLKNFSKKTLVKAVKTFANQTGWTVAQAKVLLKTLKERLSKGRRLASGDDEYGPDLGEWTKEELAKLGSLCKGLSADDFNALSLSAILGLSASGFESLENDDAIAALAARIQSMSRSDVESFDQEQVAAMPTAVRNALNNVAGNDDGDDSNTVMYVGIAAGVAVGIALVAAAVVMKGKKGKNAGRSQKYTSDELYASNELPATTKKEYTGNPARV